MQVVFQGRRWVSFSLTKPDQLVTLQQSNPNHLVDISLCGQSEHCTRVQVSQLKPYDGQTVENPPQPRK